MATTVTTTDYYIVDYNNPETIFVSNPSHDDIINYLKTNQYAFIQTKETSVRTFLAVFKTTQNKVKSYLVSGENQNFGFDPSFYKYFKKNNITLEQIPSILEQYKPNVRNDDYGHPFTHIGTIMLGIGIVSCLVFAGFLNSLFNGFNSEYNLDSSKIVTLAPNLGSDAKNTVAVKSEGKLIDFAFDINKETTGGRRMRTTKYYATIYELCKFNDSDDTYVQSYKTKNQITSDITTLTKQIQKCGASQEYKLLNYNDLGSTAAYTPNADTIESDDEVARGSVSDYFIKAAQDNKLKKPTTFITTNISTATKQDRNVRTIIAGSIATTLLIIGIYLFIRRSRAITKLNAITQEIKNRPLA
jgi:hypothetical protein